MTPRLVPALVALAAAVIPPATSADTPRQQHVERNSERVMPFSMAATMHHFDPTPSGGVQTVLVRDGDVKQVALVRAHLRTEAARFSRGDYGDPASIHGGTMPGLRALHAGARRIHVLYANVTDGGRITYASADPKLVAAIHAWFDAQVSDHGEHATMRM